MSDTLKVGITPHGCDSLVALLINVTGPVMSEDTLKIQKLCSYTWTTVEKGVTKEIGTYTETGKYDYTTETADGKCDSIIYLDLTILTAEEKDTTVADRCNEYKWPVTGITYTKSDKYKGTLKTADGKCDSIYYTLDLQLKTPAIYELEAVAAYNNRLLMINRFSINETTGWALDSLGALGVAPEVKWYRADDIRNQYQIIVYPRRGCEGGIDGLDLIDISSTEIRECIQAGKPINHLVPKAVAEYIKEHELYA